MKHIFTLLFAALAFVACTQNDIEELSANRTDVPETLTIGFEGGDDTRIQLNEAQKSVWNAGDEVSVFYKSYDNLKFQFQGKTGDRSGTLKMVDGEVGAQTMGHVVVVYPYSTSYRVSDGYSGIEAILPATQTYLNGSYGIGDNLMVSQSEFTQFSLKSVCGWLKIQLTGNGERVQSIKLRGNNEEQLAGLIYVDTATAESTLASEMGSADNNNTGGNLVFDDAIVTELTLDCGEGVVLGAEATSFYFALPPQTFEGGFTVDVECEDSEPMAISTENSVTIQRNTIQPMASIAFEGEEVITYNEIRYTATAKVEANSNYPWSFDTFGANIVSHEWDSESGEGVITFDADVTTIGQDAFDDCDSLTSITIPDSVTAIGEWVFYQCGSLTSITIGDSVTTIGEGAFNWCASLTSVTISDSVTTIGNEAFNSCASLTSVTIGDSVTTIGEWAFYGCDSLTEFNGKFASEDGRCLIVDGTLNSFAPAGLTAYTIPYSVTTIGEWAFGGCDSLTSVTIGDSVTTIGEGAFESCSSFTSITIPDSVTTIGDFAFAYCTNLISITIGDSVTTIGEDAFYWCSSLTSVTIGDSVTTIGNDAFSYCTNLISITIGDSVTTIGERAFGGCDSLVEFNGKFASEDGRCLIMDGTLNSFAPAGLTSYTIPDSVTTIGDFAFSNCNSLTNVTIPDSVTTIGHYAFAYCTNLISITIPDSVTTIGFMAFSDCDSLTSVYCEATTPPSLGGSYVFDGNASGRKIYVPAASVEAYKTADYWSEYADYIIGYDF